MSPKLSWIYAQVALRFVQRHSEQMILPAAESTSPSTGKFNQTKFIMDTPLNYTCTKDFHPLCEITVTTTVPGEWLGLITPRYILEPRHTPDNMADGHRPLYCFQSLLSSYETRTSKLGVLKAFMLPKVGGKGHTELWKCQTVLIISQKTTINE